MAGIRCESEIDYANILLARWFLGRDFRMGCMGFSRKNADRWDSCEEGEKYFDGERSTVAMLRCFDNQMQNKHFFPPIFFLLRSDFRDVP